MALSHTILAVLSQQPYSGYDISKRFEEGVSCFWQASQQQIYRELSKMEGQGWVTYETVPQAGKPDKKIYSITEAGTAELCRWYAEPSEPTPIREDLLVKVLAAPYVPDGLLVQELHRRRQLHSQRLANYQTKECLYGAIPARGDIAHADLPPIEQFRYLTLRRGMRYEQDWIDWIDEVLTFLTTQEPKASG
ncbi:PadR family transcriptional regulator [Nodosilinea sp. P-1105]|uniref:PadR family transcriptional regulator n=1 Tax=Nodosilinea sp. P-1105 TaxID=2546229 RepID=UPI00146E0020|nr:PadR family transcriptional regulator [Nodosilinea sp. P-1105]NMF86728.1 PadR family transcriptional regulator [Nodosilinea sp. P-1105]